LSRHVATFDLPQRLLYLEKAKGFGDPWVFDQSGLMLVRRRGEIVARSVGPGSPASAAGIKASDVILSVGGKPAGDLSLWEISRLFSPIGSSHRLKVRRGRGEFETKLILQEW
jgi:C-terminal processing protease CtpA/Prc